VARMITSKVLGTPTARRELTIEKQPYWLHLSQGRSLGYRKNRKGGVWIARLVSLEDGFRKEAKIGIADDVFDADGRKVFNFAQAQEEARKWFETATTKATGEAPRRGVYTVDDAMQDYLKHLREIGSRSVQTTEYIINHHIKPKLGSIRMDKITRPKITSWRSDIANSPRPSLKKKRDDEPEESAPPPLTPEQQRQRRDTANRVLTVLKAALNLAVAESRVHANPLNWKVKPFKNASAPRVRFLSAGEQRKLVAECAPDLREIVKAALHTGMRYGEIARLCVGDYNPVSSTVFVAESKAGRSRHVHLDDEAVAFFASVCDKRGTDQPMFLRTNGQPWVKDAAKKPLKNACKAAKITPCNFHALRHSAASRWVASGVPLKFVSEQLGHTSTRITEKHYAHLADTDKKKAFRNVPKLGLPEGKRAGQLIPMPGGESQSDGAA
jgi:integrase